MDYSNPVKSETYNLKKVFKIVWCVLLSLFIVWGIALASYSALYHKKQEAARLYFVDTFTLVGKVTDDSETSVNVKKFLNASREEQCEKLESMYTLWYKSYLGDDWEELSNRRNKSVFSARSDVDEAVGLPDGWTLEYLFRFPTIDVNFLLIMALKPVIYYSYEFLDETTNLISVFFYCWLVLLLISVIAQALCNNEKKKKLEINSENCVFIKGKKTKEVPIKRITNVKITPNKGVKITATGAKIKMGLVKNRVEIVNIINDLRKEVEKNGIGGAANASPTDEILKLRQLLESGLISQEEFDAKKKQLLGI